MPHPRADLWLIPEASEWKLQHINVSQFALWHRSELEVILHSLKHHLRFGLFIFVLREYDQKSYRALVSTEAGNSMRIGFTSNISASRRLTVKPCRLQKSIPEKFPPPNWSFAGAT